MLCVSDSNKPQIHNKFFSAFVKHRQLEREHVHTFLRDSHVGDMFLLKFEEIHFFLSFVNRLIDKQNTWPGALLEAWF